MRGNKINNIDLFTEKENEQFEKHIKTHSKRALEIIDKKINWKELLKPVEKNSNKAKPLFLKLEEKFFKRSQKLESLGIFDGILSKGYRNKPLTKTERRVNRLLATVRNKVERPFAYMKRILGYARCSYYDYQRN